MTIELQIDPHGKFPASPNAILEACGLLPHWLLEGLQNGEPAKDALISRYQFYFGPMEGGKILPDGRYEYPDDPYLYPLVKVEHGDEIIYFYQYAIVGVINTQTGEQWITRMD